MKMEASEPGKVRDMGRTGIAQFLKEKNLKR